MVEPPAGEQDDFDGDAGATPKSKRNAKSESEATAKL
jgi:hypothetical protein